MHFSWLHYSIKDTSGGDAGRTRLTKFYLVVVLYLGKEIIMPNIKLKKQLVSQRARSQKKPSSKAYFADMRKTIVGVFNGKYFNLRKTAAEETADTIMNIIKRNHRRAQRAGLL